MAHSVDNYVSGNGIAYIYTRPTPYVAPGALDYSDLGDAVSFTFEPKVTMKEYWGHRTGVRALDKRIKVKEEGTLRITLSEFVIDNLQMYLMADKSGTTLYPMEADSVEYGFKFVEVLEAGTSRTWEFWRAVVNPAAALELIRDGEGEGDWGKMELEVRLLDDSINHPTCKWGQCSVTPTT